MNLKVDEMIKVGMGDFKIGKAPDCIITLGLGSCVGVTFYDRVNKIGGMLHAMLPNSATALNLTNKAKFVDTGLTEILTALSKSGANLKELEIKLVGGAQMFACSDDTSVKVLKIGDNNVRATKEWISKFGLKIKAEETGENFGRTIILDTNTGELYIRAVGQTERKL